jgi:hypothetical protein
MREWILFLLLSITLVGCKQSALEKPKNLIKEEMMIDVLYDMAIIEAIKSNNPPALDKYGINPATFVYEKYHIDSLQFAKSDQYYAVNVDIYSKMFEKVNARLEAQKKALYLKGPRAVKLDRKDR